MPAAITCGSVGDIIALGQLALRLSRALKDSAGSAKQYQGLRKDLDSFSQVLVQVIATYQIHDFSVWFDNIDDLTKASVDGCAATMREVLELLAKYDCSLQAGGSGNSVKDAFKKIRWLGEKEKIAEFRQRLKTGTDKILILLNLATKVSAQLDCRAMLSRIDEVQRLINKQRKWHERTIRELEKKVAKCRDHLCSRLDSLQDSVNRQEGTLQTTLFYAKSNHVALRSLGQTVDNYTRAILNVHDAAMQAFDLRFLDPTKGLPVILQDALGNTREIPWIGSIVGSLIEHSFEDHKGFALVVRKQYVLEDGMSGEDLDMESRFSLRRGMTINMSMVFAGTKVRRCLRCHAETEVEEGRHFHCATPGCGMFLLVVKDTKQTMSKQDKYQHLLSGLTTEISGTSAVISDTGHLTQPGLADEDPSEFCRVRIFLPQQGDTAKAPHTGTASELVVSRGTQPQMPLSMLGSCIRHGYRGSSSGDSRVHNKKS